MSATRRPFRIEIAEPRRRPGAPAADPSLDRRMDRLLDEVGELKRVVVGLGAPPRPGPRGTNVAEPWASVDEIQEAIEATRSEITALRAKGVTDPSKSRAADELDAVVSDTENATEIILAAAEEIDTLIQSVISTADQAVQPAAAEIQDNVIKIFEACNFQDISGQRISKVVSLLQFIEGRLRRMEEVWQFCDLIEEESDAVDLGSDEADEMNAALDDSELLNGPALAKDNPVSQDEIDSMFR